MASSRIQKFGFWNSGYFGLRISLAAPPGLATVFLVDQLTAEEMRRAVQAALSEDIGSGDVTTLAVVPENATAKAIMRAREPLVIAGLGLAETAFSEMYG